MEPCSCGMRCSDRIVESDRILNHESYWENSTTKSCTHFITNHSKKQVTHRRRPRVKGGNVLKNHTYIELIKKIDENTHQTVRVFRCFFLHTLGYKSVNGNVIARTLNSMNPITYDPKESKTATTRS